MVTNPEHERMTARIPGILAGLLGVAVDQVKKEVGLRAREVPLADLVVTATGETFVVEYKKSTGAGPIVAALDQLRGMVKGLHRRVVPLLAVPFMGEIGRRLCEDAGIGWIDLSGNGHIITPGIRVIIDGRPNLFLSSGKPSNVFAPKSSRVIRFLLMNPAKSYTQRHISIATDMAEGFVSRIVSRLEHENYIVRDKNRAVRPRDPALLLEAWREAYQFSKHALYQGHVAARSGDSLLNFVADKLAGRNVEYAATGLSAAWVLTRFAAFRVVTVYLSADPSPAMIDRLGYREDPRGANLWIAVPNDKGVFQGASVKRGIHCVHPVQAYVDLKAQPERASEAAERLRSELLNWGRND
jgi:hypothetical protein